jgi:hypothetical protein
MPDAHAKAHIRAWCEYDAHVTSVRSHDFLTAALATDDPDGSCIPTVGEYASHVLSSFERLRQAGDDVGSISWPDVRLDAVDFLRSCLALAHKFPSQSRIAFERSLPFSRLETELMRRKDVSQEHVADLVTSRVIEWASRSPVFIEEDNVHAADFLIQLTPHLDLWRERKLAMQTAESMAHI